MAIELPDCVTGGKCELLSRDAIMDRRGVSQCRKCSTVYEATGWRRRKCDHCGKEWGESLIDPCLEYIDGVAEMCCGHGDPTQAYKSWRPGRYEGKGA